MSIPDRRYQRIIFFQGEEADKPLEILREQGREATIKYLALWDNGDGAEESDSPSHGTSDRVYTFEGYSLVWNDRLNYIGLERVTQARAKN